MKMYVDHYLKNINYYSHLCLLQKFNLGKISKMENKFIYLIGDIFLLDLLGKFKLSPILLPLYLTAHGLIYIGNFME